MINFQSHFGLILSGAGTPSMTFLHETFNPILVWFYLWFIQTPASCSVKLSIPFWSDFIILLRSQQVKCLPCFQSHFGLILSEKFLEQEWQWLITFNPILVWFYLHTIQTRHLRWKAFQSHFGLILSAPTTVYSAIGSSSFNPILVWFYLALPSFFYEKVVALSIPFWSDFI